MPRRRLRVGNDCAGILAPLFALDALGVPYDHVFASEIDRQARRAIQANKPPRVLYGDMRTRDAASVPRVDLYFCGFPCVPFSRAGKEEGFAGKGGDVFFHVLEYIRRRRPTVFVLENVAALMTHRNGRTFEVMDRHLRGLGSYDTEYLTLDTQDYGLPQRRKRLYIVGRARRAATGRLRTPPASATRASLMDVIRLAGGDRVTPATAPSLYRLSPSKRDPGKFADLRRKFGVRDLRRHPIVALLGQGRSYVTSGYGVVPTLQRRCDFFVTSLGREISAREALALQGFPPSFKVVCSKAQTYRQAGNAMSVNVVRALLAEVLRCTRLP